MLTLFEGNHIKTLKTNANILLKFTFNHKINIGTICTNVI